MLGRHFLCNKSICQANIIMLSKFSKFVFTYSRVGVDCSGNSSDFASSLLFKCIAKSMCFVVISAGVARARNRPHFKARFSGQVGELLVNDVVLSEFFLISVDFMDVNGHSDSFGDKKNEAVD